MFLPTQQTPISKHVGPHFAFPYFLCQAQWIYTDGGRGGIILAAFSFNFKINEFSRTVTVLTLHINQIEILMKQV